MPQTLTFCAKYYVLSVTMCIVILLLSLLPVSVPEIARDVPFLDKWAHFLMYGSLTAIIWFENSCNEACERVKLSWTVILAFGAVGPTILGGLMELGQTYLTQTRSGEWMDVFADAFGVLIGTACGIVLRHAILRRSKAA